jgi:hypothetical protein
LLDYQLDFGRELVRERVTDPLWQTRAGWHNLNNKLSDDLASAAADFAIIYGYWRQLKGINILKSRPASHKIGNPDYANARSSEIDQDDPHPLLNNAWVVRQSGALVRSLSRNDFEHFKKTGELPKPPRRLPDGEGLLPKGMWMQPTRTEPPPEKSVGPLKDEIRDLLKLIERSLMPKELQAVIDYAAHNEHPTSWERVESGLRKIYCILNNAEPQTKVAVRDERRSQYAKDTRNGLTVRNLHTPVDGMSGIERFGIAYASANNIALPNLVRKHFEIAKERARKRHSDYDEHQEAIDALFRDGVVEQTANIDQDFDRAYRLAKEYAQKAPKNGTE